MPDLPRRRRPQRPSWTEPLIQRLTPAVKVLVIVETLLYFLYVGVGNLRGPMEAHLGLGPGFFKGELWQPLTAVLVEFSFLGWVFGLIGVWFVGAFIERQHGTRRFLGLFFAAGVLSHLVVALVSRATGWAGGIVSGSSFAVLALFVAFGRLYGRQQSQILGGLFLQARYIALIFVGWSALASILARNWALLAGTFMAAAVGYFLAAPGGFRELYDLIRVRRLRRRYRVLEGGAPRRARSPKYWN